MHKPLISILLAAYNEENCISKAIESIQSQSFKYWELIIIDDCSSDKTENIIKDFSKFDNRIKLIANKNNIGLAASLNIGLKKAKTNFIARADADDTYQPDRLQKQYDFLIKNKHIDIVGTGAWLLNKKGEKIKCVSLPETNEILKNLPFLKTIFFHSSILARKNFFIKVGDYNESFLRSQDKELWLRGYKYGCIYANLKEPLIKYNTNDYISTWKNLTLSTLSLIKIQKNYKYRFGFILICKFLLISILTKMKVWRPLTKSFFF